MNFQEKLEKILRDGKSTVLTESEEAYGTNSPTHVKPEHGQEVTSSLNGTGKIDATGPIPTGAEATLKTTPGVSASEGPTGHIPQNSDLPRPQLTGLDKDNKNPGKNSLPPTPKVYGLHEEEEEEKAKKLKEEEEEKKLPPFMRKKKTVKEEEEEEKAKKLKEEEEKKLKEETDAARTLKRPPSGAGEKADKLATKEEFDNELKHAKHSETKLKEEEEAKKLKEEEEEKKLKEEEEDKKSDEKAVKEATAALFVGETISEVLKEKTATIFEATLSSRIKEYRKVLTDRFTKTLNERVEQIREQLTESVGDHLDLVVEHWVKQNEVPLERAIKSELVEEFISDLKTVFENHYIDLPQEKVDIVAEMVKRINTLETRLNEQIDTNAKLNKTVKLHERNEVFDKVSKGLVTTKIEKLRSLSEQVEYKTSSQFETALTTLKESIDSGTKNVPTQNLSEQVLEESPDALSGDVMGRLKTTLRRMKENSNN